MHKSRKPLVLWCRWNNAALRLRGKDDRTLVGELAFDDGDVEPFTFDMHTWTLTRTSDGREISEQLDEMGIVRANGY